MHNVRAPSGPLRHSGVSLVPQCLHTVGSGPSLDRFLAEIVTVELEAEPAGGAGLKRAESEVVRS